MSKNKKPQSAAAPSTTEESTATAKEAAAGDDAVQPKPRRYLCSLRALTHVEHNDVEIEAENEAEAKAKFMAQNGISDSTHPFTATLVIDEADETVAENEAATEANSPAAPPATEVPTDTNPVAATAATEANSPAAPPASDTASK